ncbi:Low-temperature-induced 65 kDa protein [Rhynchospora pubera]|uniref:Low-temperature-induced 65 kDa protein n=1 Tax=Rhynchospora pubera TaxID=906938 RepID=A0AAV8ESS7_9POAL|nr:Low-temperature-induced 65 kDa protein [Rhynchospora pubera]
MQSQLVRPHQGHADAQEVDPHVAGLRTAIVGEEKQHDEKPAVLKKVKEKVKKIKDKIGKKKHDDGRDHDSDTSSGEGEEDGYKEDDELEISSAPTSEPQEVLTGDAGKVEPEKVRLRDAVTGDIKEDPAAPMSTNPPARGGEEIGMTPVVQAFESLDVSKESKPELERKPEIQQPADTGFTDQLNVSDEPMTEQELKPETQQSADTGFTDQLSVSDEPMTEQEPKPETQQSADTGSTDQPSVTYTEKLKSMATVPAEYGKNVASTVYDKLSTAGTAVVRKIRGEPTEKGETETSREINEDKGVSVKEYLSEKLKPGEEEEALSEVISETVQGSKEGAVDKAKKGMETAQTRAGGVRMVEKIRGAVTSVVGGSGAGGGAGGGSDTTAGSDLSQETGSDVAPELMKQD